MTIEIELGNNNKVVAMKGSCKVKDIRDRGIICGSVRNLSKTKVLNNSSS